jgi:hypothetical protein
MVTRNVYRPAYALALLFSVVAIADAVNAVVAMQTTRSGANPGWVIDLIAAGISAAFVALLLMRPHAYVFGAAVAWAAIAFVVNFALRQPDSVDSVATYRMVTYFLVFVVAGVLVAAELWERQEPQRVARRAGVRSWSPFGSTGPATPPYNPYPSGPMAVPASAPAPAPAPAPAAPPASAPETSPPGQPPEPPASE